MCAVDHQFILLLGFWNSLPKLDHGIDSSIIVFVVDSSFNGDGLSCSPLITQDFVWMSSSSIFTFCCSQWELLVYLVLRVIAYSLLLCHLIIYFLYYPFVRP